MIYGNRFLHHINENYETNFDKIQAIIENTLNDKFIFKDLLNNCIVSESSTVIVINEGAGDVIKSIFKAIKDAIVKFLTMLKNLVTGFISKIKGLFSKNKSDGTSSSSSSTSNDNSNANNVKKEPEFWVDYSVFLQDLQSGFGNSEIKNLEDILGDAFEMPEEGYLDLDKKIIVNKEGVKNLVADSLKKLKDSINNSLPILIFKPTGKLTLPKSQDTTAFKKDLDEMIKNACDPANSPYKIPVPKTDDEKTKLQDKFKKSISQGLSFLDKYSKELDKSLKVVQNNFSIIEKEMIGDINVQLQGFKQEDQNFIVQQYTVIVSNIKTETSNILTLANTSVKSVCMVISNTSKKAGLL